MSVKQREKKRADVRAVHVGIGRDDDLVVAEFADIKNVADRGAERNDEIFYLLACEHFIESSAFYIENFSTERKDCLNAPIAAGLCGAACGISLDYEKLAFARVLALAVGEFARE